MYRERERGTERWIRVGTEEQQPQAEKNATPLLSFDLIRFDFDPAVPFLVG